MESAIEYGETGGFTPLDASSQITATQAAENLQILAKTGDPADPDTTPPDKVELALVSFNEKITAPGLIEMQAEVDLLPTVATDEAEYNTVFVAHQRFKGIHLACRRKAEELTKKLKENFKTAKADNKTALELLKTTFATDTTRITEALAHVLEKIDPINKQLATAREDWDVEQDSIKTKKAEAVAAKQAIEQDRIHRARCYDQAWIECADWNADKAETARLDQERIDTDERQAAQQKVLDNAAEKLKQDKYEWDCERSRLEPDEAWTEAHPVATVPSVYEGNAPREASQWMDPNEILPKPPLTGNELTESDLDTIERKFDTSPPVETETFADIEKKIPDASTGFAITNSDACNLIVNSEHDIIYSTDPAEKEKQLLEQDVDRLIEIGNYTNQVVIDWLNVELHAGFESKTATSALRRLIESIQAAADIFEHEVGLNKPAPDPDSGVSEKDCPF